MGIDDTEEDKWFCLLIVHIPHDKQQILAQISDEAALETVQTIARRANSMPIQSSNGGEMSRLRQPVRAGRLYPKGLVFLSAAGRDNRHTWL